MTETAEQYRTRLATYVEGTDPIAMQREATGTITRLIEGVADAKLKDQPTPGKWSVTEILMHLAEDELVSTWRYRQMLEHETPELAGFDQDLWARLGDYASCEHGLPIKHSIAFCQMTGYTLPVRSRAVPAELKLGIDRTNLEANASNRNQHLTKWARIGYDLVIASFWLRVSQLAIDQCCHLFWTTHDLGLAANLDGSVVAGGRGLGRIGTSSPSKWLGCIRVHR